MFSQLKKELDAQLPRFIKDVDRHFGLRAISPLIFDKIQEYICRDGKRIRPILFVLGYRGFSRKQPKNLYTSALATEILHDFLLIHDDIIDKSDMRRGKPAMHTMLNQYLKVYPQAKFNGSDLAIVIGDIMYAIAIEAFLSIEENPVRKEKALRKFIEAACYTGCGEFIDTVSGAKNIENISEKEIYAIYDYKTAYYTFSCPLTTGAILAGAKEKDIAYLHKYGIYLGRAFQIKDDILGIFAEEAHTGKSSTSDIEENKKTLLLWHAFQHATKTEKDEINTLLGKNKISLSDIEKMRAIMTRTKSLEYAKNSIASMLAEALTAIKHCTIKTDYKKTLTEYSQAILKV